MTVPLVNPTPPVDPAPVVPGQPAPSPAPAPAPVVPAPFDPNALSPEIKAYLASETARIKAEEGARERTASKANAAAEARADLLKQLGLKPDVTPQDAAAELAQERAERKAERVQGAVERAAGKAGADDELVASYLASKGRLKDLDPSASDFADKVKTLIDAALVEKPSLKLATAPPVTPPGGQGPGSGVVPGSQPAPAKRDPSLVNAYAKLYAPKTQ
jgi:uncharacterized protein YjbJ (UPF0337 family)